MHILMQGILGEARVVSMLEARQLLHLKSFPIFLIIQNIWDLVKSVLNYEGLSLYIPLWGND